MHRFAHITCAAALVASPRWLAAADNEPPAGATANEAALARRVGDLEEKLRRSEADRQSTEQAAREAQLRLEERVEEIAPVTGKIGGYLDVGFFRVGGDGSGLRSDFGYQVLPEYQGQVPDSWVFLGDPLATTVNARGEPASTGESRAVTFDPVRAGGRPTFMLNSLTLVLFGAVGERLSVNGAVDFVPRRRDVSDPAGMGLGDHFDVKLAYVEYIVPVERFGLSLFAGKFDSVLGIEYRRQDAPDRITVTPSIICRYTCGRPVGLKARAKFLDEALVVNVAVTNGSHMIELFPFYDEVDSNSRKTLAGRLSYRLPVGAGLEGGVSGAMGAQDGQSVDSVQQYHLGADLALDWHDLILAAEVVWGRAEGLTEAGGIACGLAPCLRYKGAYLLTAYRVTNWVAPYLRTDWRDALHRSGASFVYYSKVVRATGGLRFEIGTHVIVKAEFTRVIELDPLPDFADDVFTSALVVKY